MKECFEASAKLLCVEAGGGKMRKRLPDDGLLRRVILAQPPAEALC
jgi:hypothetical protein